MKRFEILDHTADMGIRVYGKDFKNLFQNAAEALFKCIGDTRHVRADQWVDLEITGMDKEDLMVSWLRELLYLFDVKELFLSRFQILEIIENKLKARVGGETMDVERHHIVREVKAVTYHGIRVENVPFPQEHWEAEIIFDV